MQAADTIVALASAPGPAGVAVLRISGPDALAIGAALAGRSPQRMPHGRMQVARMRERDEILDQGYAVAFRGPRSFTGEDVVELHVHGSPAGVARLLAAAVAHGARRAGPGEFSRRAFLNGKLDLVQAESLAALVSADSESARRSALAGVDGRLGERMRALREPIVELRAAIEARLDFPVDADVDAFDAATAITTLAGLTLKLAGLLATARAARLRLQGARVALAGPPNAGKSTLFNALVGTDRALVHEAPGTTRDTLECTTLVAGRTVVWVDMAGDRETTDTVEREGVARARRAVAAADLVLWLEDGGEPPCPSPSVPDHVPFLRLRGKGDQPPHPAWAAAASATDDVVSGHRAGDVERVLARVAALLDQLEGDCRGDDVVLTRARQADGIERAMAAVAAASEALREGALLECVAADLAAAGDALDEVIGAVVPDDVLDAVFGSFCIGK